jgi:hypothetical protein
MQNRAKAGHLRHGTREWATAVKKLNKKQKKAFLVTRHDEEVFERWRVKGTTTKIVEQKYGSVKRFTVAFKVCCNGHTHTRDHRWRGCCADDGCRLRSAPAPPHIRISPAVRQDL